MSYNKTILLTSFLMITTAVKVWNLFKQTSIIFDLEILGYMWRTVRRWMHFPICLCKVCSCMQWCCINNIKSSIDQVTLLLLCQGVLLVPALVCCQSQWWPGVNSLAELQWWVPGVSDHWWWSLQVPVQLWRIQTPWMCCKGWSLELCHWCEHRVWCC